MIEIPTIDLGSILPVAGLALIAVVCVAALLIHSLLHSRIALLIAVVIGVVAAGPVLAGALRDMIWALAPVVIVVVAGAVAVLWLVQRNPDMMAIMRDVSDRRTPPQVPLLEDRKDQTVVIDQPRGEQVRRPARQIQIINKDMGDRWGF